MTLDQAIEFIVAKFELIIEHLPDSPAREIVRRMAAGTEALWCHPRLSMQQLRDLDGEMLEQVMDNSFSEAGAAEIRRQLTARFKTSRLRAADAQVARRVLKRAGIASLEEYYQVKEYVSCVDHIDEIGEENYRELDRLLENYNGPDEEIPEPTPILKGRPSRRRPPSPFDLVLVPDEKLCPPETPLETRVNFVRAKFALVIECASSPQIRETLQNQLKWGIDFAFGPHTPPEHRLARLELCEHEAEFFCGDSVSGAQHRAVEAKLENEFGFRRLGPSAQSRVARMLATRDARDQYNRLFIERFIYNYPHQTLFTREQMKRAKQLLKEPSPSQPPAAIVMPARPRTPPDFSQLCIGAVFKTKHSDKPCRVIAFDDIEVFYDVNWGETVGWGLEHGRGRAIYYRHVTPLFLDEAEKLRVDPPSAEFLARHRPDLPLRFGRSARLQWTDAPRTRDEFMAHLRQMEPTLLDQPAIPVARLALVPRTSSGAIKRPVLVAAENGTALTIPELLWHAYPHQRALKWESAEGIGFYRSGIEKNGTPSYVMAGFLGPGGTLRWHAEAPPAS